MAEALGTTAALIDIIDTVRKGMEFIKTIRGADEEILRLQKSANRLKNLLEGWEKVLKEGAEDDRMFQTIKNIAKNDPLNYGKKDGRSTSPENSKRDRLSAVFSRWRSSSSSRPLASREDSAGTLGGDMLTDAPEYTIFTDLNELQKEIEEATRKREKDTRLYRGARFAFSDIESMAKLKKEIDSVADEIRHAAEIDSLALQVDTNKVLRASVRQNEEERARNEQREAEEERERELEKLGSFLSPLDFTEKEDSFREHDPYGKWFLDGEEFQNWSSGRPWQLFCYGDPGAGKTVISTITRRYLTDRFKDDDCAILSLFLDKQNERDQTLQNLLGSLANQLIRHLGNRFDPAEARQFFARYSFKKGKPSVQELEDFIDSQIAKLERTYVIVDALDETSMEISDDLIRRLKKEQLIVMFTSRTVASRSKEIQVNCDTCERQDIKVFWGCMDCFKTKERLQITICLTCRNDGKGCPRNPNHEMKEPRGRFSIEIRTPSTVIEQFVKDKIDAVCGTGRARNRDWDFDKDDDFDVNAGFFGGILRGDDDLRKELPVKISQSVNDSFLMTTRLWERLERQHNPEKIREILDKPLDLGDTYEHDMRRILEKSSEDRNLALRVLCWLTYAPRLLSFSELQTALAVREGDRDTPSQGRLTHRKIILSVTAGLVSIEWNIVKLYHLTAKEYLTRTRDKWFPDAGVELAKTCFAYLNFDEFSEPCLKDIEEEELPARYEQYGFFRYSSHFWGEHVRHCNLGEDSSIREKALGLLRDDDRLEAVVQGAEELWDVRRGVNALHVAAFFGLTELVPEMILDGIKVDAQDDRYEQTALVYACRKGHPKTVQKLLGLGADINHRTRRGSRPIFEAILHGHTETVRILTRSNELSINEIQNNDGNTTALIMATTVGKIDTVRVLLKAGASPEQQDCDGTTPLMFAVRGRNYQIMQLLIDNARDSKALNLTNRHGQTALSIAAANIDKDAVKALLKKHADPMILDMVDEGNVAFRTMDYEVDDAEKERLDIIQMLLNSNPALLLSKNRFGKGLMHAASGKGFTNILEELLKRGCDINQKANNGQTPLHEACCTGEPESVELLVKNGANRHAKDNFGRSPRVVAVQNGQIDLLRLLDDGGDDDDTGDIANDLSAIPAWSLAKQGHIEPLAIKIKADPQCVHVEDPDTSNTALHFAVSTDEASLEIKHMMTEMLLDAGASCDAQNAEGMTPLHFIALNGPSEILDALLAVNPDLEITSVWGDTALDTAQGSDQWVVANKLVEAAAIVNPTKHSLQQLFITAVEIGCPMSMQILVNLGADVQAMGNDGVKAKDIALNAPYDEELKRQVLSVIKRTRSVFHSNSELTKSPVQTGSEDDEAEEEARREWLVKDIIGNAPSPPLSEPGKSEPGSIMVPPRRPIALAECLKAA